jgi:hypothetical protein
VTVKFFIIALGLFAASVQAEEGFDDDEGFDEEIIELIIDETPAAKGLLYGSVEFETHYNYKDENTTSDVSSAKALADLLGEYKLDNGYKIKGNLKLYHDFVYNTNADDERTPEGYETEINLNELTLEGSVSPQLDFKIGRQIVVWGKSDTIRITDILNPLDNRVPGLVDIKNLRLGRVMSKLDYYFDEMNLSTIILHENRFSENPKLGSDFNTTADLPSNEPDDELDNSGVAISLTGAFEGYDFGAYFANTYVDKPYVEDNILQYDNRTSMVGFAYNKVVDQYLLKAEGARFNKLKYSDVDEPKTRVDLLLGVEYSGITDGSIGYEIALRSIKNYDDLINTEANNFTPKEEYQHAVRFTQAYLNQTLDFNALVSLFGASAKQGGFARLSLDYAFDDEISMSGGVIDYIGGDNPAFDAYQDNDRIFAKISHTF